MNAHTIVLDVADARERAILDRLMQACDPDDVVEVCLRGDRIVLKLGG